MNVSKKIEGGIFQPSKLEVDEDIFDKNLRIIDDGGEHADLPFLRQESRNLSDPKGLLPTDDLPSISVIPDPGMCVKTKNIEGKKVFINVCKVQAIPPPRPISEEALQNIIANEDYTSDYRIPMSLGAPRVEKDKSGKECMACDVAVNSVWYDQTMVESITFTTFLVHLAMEGLCEKYGESCNMDRQNWSILRNKKFMGKPQRHVIQHRASASKIQDITGIDDKANSQMHAISSKALITPLKERPKLLLVKNPPDSEFPQMLNATISLPKVVVYKEIGLELGQDRMILESDHYSLDIFLPFKVDPDDTLASFHRDKRELILKMKVML